MLKQLTGNLDEVLEWEELGPVPHRWRELDARKRNALGRRKNEMDFHRLPPRPRLERGTSR